MNYAEFLQRLEATPRDWHMTQSGRIRRGPNACVCPLDACFVAITGLSRGEELLIIRAADNCGSFDSQVRADLLRACGLET